MVVSLKRSYKFIWCNTPKRQGEVERDCNNYYRQKVFFLNFYLCTYFWLCWVFIAARAFLQLQRVGATLQLLCAGFSLQWLLLLWSSGSRACRLSGWGFRTLEHRLRSCGTRAQLLHSMWDLPGTGIKPVSPALAGRFFTTESPRKFQFNAHHT